MNRPRRAIISRCLRATVPWTALAAIPFLGGATSEDAALLASRRQKIQGLSQSEINRLKRNYDTFRALSQEQRDDLFRLHDEVQQDAKNRGHLQKLLEGYNRWFSSLSPFDRDAILSKTDPVERAMQVEKLRADQKKQQQANVHAGAFAAAHFVDGHTILNSQALETVVNAIEKDFLSQDAKKEVQQQMPTGRDRHVRIFKLAREQVQRERRASIGGDPPQKILMATIIKAIPDEKLKARVQEAPRQQLGQLIRQSLLAEWRDEIESVPLTQEQKEEFLDRFQSSMLSARRREAFEDRRKKNPRQAQRIAEVEMALDNNPKLEELRPVARWLVGGFVNDRSFGGLGRQRLNQKKPNKAQSSAPATKSANPAGAF